MKLIIEIDEKKYEEIKRIAKAQFEITDKTEAQIIANGTPYEERPQGEWIGNVFDEHHCNRCGHPALWEEEPDDYYEVQSRFCPNCGADMRGGSK